MPSITVDEAKQRFADLIEHLRPGEELIIMRDDEPVARIIGEPPRPSKPRKLGTLAGTVLYISPDFDAPLEDVRDYMQRFPIIIAIPLTECSSRRLRRNRFPL